LALYTNLIGTNKHYLQKEENMKIGDRVKELRNTLKLTQKQLGEALGVTHQNIQNLEKNRVDSPRYLSKLAELLQTTTDFLLNGTVAAKLIKTPVNTDIDQRILETCIDTVLEVADDKSIDLSSAQAAKLAAYVYTQSIKNETDCSDKVVVSDLMSLVL